MAILSKTLASGNEGCWRIAFDLEELHLYVGFAKEGALPLSGMTVEDFLVTVPASPLHRKAHVRLVQLLRALLQDA